MIWNHILDKQPKDGEIIIQVDPPYELYKGDFKNHYCMGMREYVQSCSFEAVLEFCELNDMEKPNFWWIYPKDFPFPEHKL